MGVPGGNSRTAIRSMSLPTVVICAASLSLFSLTNAVAKPARCFTTDDGHYPCEFRLVEFNGSFEISAPGVPTYSMIMDAPGYAYGFVNFGDRNIALPGPYEREIDEPACWRNLETDTKICAW